MKNLKIFALMLVVGAVVFSGCGKDDPEGPTLTISANVTEAWENDTIIFTYSVASNEELKLLSYTTSAPNIVANGEVALSGNSVSNETLEVKLPSTGITNNSSITFTFTATDKDGEEWGDTKEITITLKEPAAAGTVLAYENTAGVIWNLIGPNQGAWDLVANVGKSSTDADADKDMINTSTVSLGWVNAWTAGNSTMFVKDNSFDYAAGTLEDAQTAYSNGSASATVTTPAVGDIYIAKLRGGSDYAVIKITGVTETASDNLDNIAFSYKKVAQ